MGFFFFTKLKDDGTLNRFKAWLVTNGFHQEEVDFLETFNPVVKPNTIRIVHVVVTIHGWPTHQLDVGNAFLHDNLSIPIYMEQPQVF